MFKGAEVGVEVRCYADVAVCAEPFICFNLKFNPKEIHSEIQDLSQKQVFVNLFCLCMCMRQTTSTKYD